MRTTTALAAVVFLWSNVSGAAEAQAPALKTEDEKSIYALGYMVGKSLQTFTMSKEEQAIFKKALTEGLAGEKPAVNVDEYRPKVDALAKARGQAKAQKEAAKEKEKSKPFLEKAAAEKGAQKLPSGLIYTDLKVGTGESPKPTQMVSVHYRGTLIDGTEFDSSYKRNQPAEFPLNGVIPCWTEGVQKMKVGGKAKLVCPSSIAYGDSGRPPTIPPGATLVFEVELLSIKK